MTIEINDPTVQKWIEDKIAAGRFPSAEALVAAAVASFEADREATATFGEFAPGELDRLLAEGLDSGPPIDGEEAFLARRRDRQAAAAKRAGQVA